MRFQCPTLHSLLTVRAQATICVDMCDGHRLLDCLSTFIYRSLHIVLYTDHGEQINRPDFGARIIRSDPPDYRFIHEDALMIRQ
jgi:hypothetical protein